MKTIFLNKPDPDQAPLEKPPSGVWTASVSAVIEKLKENAKF